MTEVAPVRFGILGAGRIATNSLAPAVHAAPSAELRAVASRDIDRAKATNPARAYDSYEALLDDPEVEAVIVATHNGLHCEQTLAALERGKHVLCEKPLGRTVAECVEMVALAQRKGLLLEEAFMHRFHPQMAEGLRVVKSGEIGDVKTIEASFSFAIAGEDDVRMNPDWGGGAAYDVGCYCINFCRTFLGEPVAVKAMGAFHPTRRVDMALHGVLDFGEGRFGVVSCGFDSGGENDARLRGTLGTMHFPSPFWVNNQPATLEIGSANPRTLSYEPVNLYAAEVEDFALAIRGGRRPLLPPTDGLKNLRVMEALLASARDDSAAAI